MSIAPESPTEVNKPPLDMDQVRVDPAFALRLPPALALRRMVLPFAVMDGQVYVACVDENDVARCKPCNGCLSNPVRAERRNRNRSSGALSNLRRRQESVPVIVQTRGRIDLAKPTPTRKTRPACATNCSMPDRASGVRRAYRSL
jgi:hypothetical protein